MSETQFHLTVYDQMFIQLLGRTKRAVRDVRDAIEEEKLLSSGDKLHQISVDLQTLTRENEYLNHEVQNCPI